jgi:hypothetical protein
MVLLPLKIEVMKTSMRKIIRNHRESEILRHSHFHRKPTLTLSKKRTEKLFGAVWPMFYSDMFNVDGLASHTPVSFDNTTKSKLFTICFSQGNTHIEALHKKTNYFVSDWAIMPENVILSEKKDLLKAIIPNYHFKMDFGADFYPYNFVPEWDVVETPKENLEKKKELGENTEHEETSKKETNNDFFVDWSIR